MRLERELSDEAVAALNESFSDLMKSGKITKTEPLPQEKDQPELLAKPRISFQYDQRNAGRPNEIILAVNEMGGQV